MFEDSEDQHREERDEIAQIKLNAEMEENLYDLKDKLVRNNWILLLEKGVDFKSMQENDLDTVPIIRTLNQMIEWFQEVEEYEKCAHIKKILDSQ
tara:strand:- start:8742 stop:9026 length:285 start_codon:yes stop_codon:yes gene_type:complete